MVKAVIDHEQLELFIAATAKRREVDSSAATLFREYLVKSLAVFDHHKAAGWPFQPLSDVLDHDDEDWTEVESFVERVIEGGVYRQILAINYLKWQDRVSAGRIRISSNDDPYIPLAKFLATGAPVNREHKFVDVGMGVFELRPELYRVNN